LKRAPDSAGFPLRTDRTSEARLVLHLFPYFLSLLQEGPSGNKGVVPRSTYTPFFCHPLTPYLSFFSAPLFSSPKFRPTSVVPLDMPHARFLSADVSPDFFFSFPSLLISPCRDGCALSIATGLRRRRVRTFFPQFRSFSPFLVSVTFSVFTPSLLFKTIPPIVRPVCSFGEAGVSISRVNPLYSHSGPVLLLGNVFFSLKLFLSFLFLAVLAPNSWQWAPLGLNHIQPFDAYFPIFDPFHLHVYTSCPGAETPVIPPLPSDPSEPTRIRPFQLEFLSLPVSLPEILPFFQNRDYPPDWFFCVSRWPYRKEWSF